MYHFVERSGGDFTVTHRLSQKTDDWEPLRVEAGKPLDYEDMSDYIRAWPDKLVSFVADRLCDDDMGVFARELYEYICEADHDGPAFEEWRTS